jgi:hypothetical protein
MKCDDSYNQPSTERGGKGVFMIPLCLIFTIIIEDWDDNGGINNG